MAPGAELDVHVLERVLRRALHPEVAIVQEVRDLELRLRLHDVALLRLECLEARVRVDDVAEHHPVELHRRADLEARVLRERELHALLPALELPRAARDRDRVVEHLVHVLAANDMSCVDASGDERLPRRERRPEDDRPRLAGAGDGADVLEARAADDVELRVHVDPPGRLPVLARDRLAVAPDRRGLVLERDGLRIRLDELRLALEQPRDELRLRVVDLAAVPDVVRDQAGRQQVVVDPVPAERRRLLLVDEDDRAGRRALWRGRGCRPEHEACADRERADRERDRRSPHPPRRPLHVHDHTFLRRSQ